MSDLSSSFDDVANRNAGRPIVYDSSFKDNLIAWLATGGFLRDWCQIPGNPTQFWVWNETKRDADFRARFREAREMQGHAFAEKAVQSALDATPMDAVSQRLHFDAQKWFAGRLNPATYGDKVRTEITGADGGPVQSQMVESLATVDPVEAARQYQKMIEGED